MIYPRFIPEGKEYYNLTLSGSIALQNSVFQNFMASSIDIPMPLRKRPYCWRPQCLKWWVCVRPWCKFCMQGGNDFLLNCKQNKKHWLRTWVVHSSGRKFTNLNRQIYEPFALWWWQTPYDVSIAKTLSVFEVESKHKYCCSSSDGKCPASPKYGRPKRDIAQAVNIY